MAPIPSYISSNTEYVSVKNISYTSTIHLTKKEVAEILEEIGILLELKGENVFKTRAYQNASRTIAGLTGDLPEMVKTGTIKDVKGIGTALAEKITTLVTTGKLPYYETLKASFPPTLLELLGIPGLGPKKIKKLYDTLNIGSLTDLEQACRNNKLADLEGFGQKTQENILRGIESKKKFSEKFYYHVAEEAARNYLEYLKKFKGVIRSEVAGSLRRYKEIIGDIDILISAKPKDVQEIMKTFISYDDIHHVVAEGETKSSVVLNSGINVDLRVVSDKEFPFALHYFTGSKEHNVHIRRIARDKKLKLNEYGLFRETTQKAVVCKEETAIFKTLGLSYIPPELREDMGEIEAAMKGTLPQLIEEKDLRGTFHCHTSYSDGINTVREMMEAAQARGWKYLGIADHSRSAQYARGLSVDQLKKQRKEIDALNNQAKGFRLFLGVESDILQDGSLDYDDKTCASLDYIVASVHSRFKMPEREMTARIIKALKNKYTTILGHPTGRLLLSREPYAVDVIKIIDAASDYGKAIEINSHPYRLDLDWRMVKYAKEKGVKIFINPDAHSTDGLGDVRFGVGIGRKGWLQAQDVVNTLSLRKVESYLAK
jgi:DNA polymerase (family X)